MIDNPDIPVQSTGADPSWWLYTGDGTRKQVTIPPPPPWRNFETEPALTPDGDEPVVPVETDNDERRLGRFASTVTRRKLDRQLNLINAAIHLRRPMLITGRAGTGKSTLARSIAAELGLGRVLHWPITSRSTLDYGLYRYDAIGRLQEVNLIQAVARLRAESGDAQTRPEVPDIGQFLRLGPLGSAMVARSRPRVLLIDEIDKSDIDLPNDLLTVFEDGYFEIPELTRLRSRDPVHVMDNDSDARVGIVGGVVKCLQFPIIIMTSNGERDFPPAFLRRSIRLRLDVPDRQRVAEIVEAHFGAGGIDDRARSVMARFVQRLETHENLATDQLMNALYMTTSGARGPDERLEELIDDLTRSLSESDR